MSVDRGYRRKERKKATYTQRNRCESKEVGEMDGEATITVHFPGGKGKYGNIPLFVFSKWLVGALFILMHAPWFPPMEVSGISTGHGGPRGCSTPQLIYVDRIGLNLHTLWHVIIKSP